MGAEGISKSVISEQSCDKEPIWIALVMSKYKHTYFYEWKIGVDLNTCAGECGRSEAERQEMQNLSSGVM